jgi:hypothetical protein
MNLTTPFNLILATQGGGKRRASTISYSSLNSLRVMDRSRAASRTPLCANSMILDATKRVAGSSLSLRPNSAHTLSNATDMLRIASGSKAAPLRNGRIGIAIPRRKIHDHWANASAAVMAPLV